MSSELATPLPKRPAEPSQHVTPIFIETPRLPRLLRPLKGKLINFGKAAQEAPEAMRCLIGAQTPRKRPLPSSNGDGNGSQPRFLYSKRRRRAGTACDQGGQGEQDSAELLTMPILSMLMPRRKLSSNAAEIRTPLRASVLSIQDGFRDLLQKTWRPPQFSERGVLPLAQLTAFKVGHEIANEALDLEQTNELEDLYEAIPPRPRGFTIMQQAVSLCALHVKVPNVLLRLLAVCVDHKCLLQAEFLLKVLFEMAQTLQLDQFLSCLALAERLDIGHKAIRLLCACIGPELISRSTFYHFGVSLSKKNPEWFVEVADCLLVQALLHPGLAKHNYVRPWARMLMSAASKVDLIPSRLVPSLSRSPECLHIAHVSTIYSLILLHVALDPDAITFDTWALLRDVHPQSDIALVYETTDRNAWIKIAKELRRHHLASHAVQIINYMLDDEDSTQLARLLAELEEEVQNQKENWKYEPWLETWIQGTPQNDHSGIPSSDSIVATPCSKRSMKPSKASCSGGLDADQNLVSAKTAQTSRASSRQVMLELEAENSGCTSIPVSFAAPQTPSNRQSRRGVIIGTPLPITDEPDEFLM